MHRISSMAGQRRGGRSRFISDSFFAFYVIVVLFTVSTIKLYQSISPPVSSHEGLNNVESALDNSKSNLAIKKSFSEQLGNVAVESDMAGEADDDDDDEAGSDTEEQADNGEQTETDDEADKTEVDTDDEADRNEQADKEEDDNGDDDEAETDDEASAQTDGKADGESVSKKNSEIAGLSCKRYGGPDDSLAEEMVYWKDIESDFEYVSPFKKEGVAQYLTFEPDHGGWNNIRMAMETVLAMAFAMGRILVLPPEHNMYLLSKDKGKHGKQRSTFSFYHFFPMEDIAEEHPGLDIITMEEYLKREAMTGNFRDRHGKVSFPPGNVTNWDGKNINSLYQWLKEVTYVPPDWRPSHCMVTFPSSTNPEDIKKLSAIEKEILKSHPNWKEFRGKPVGVDASTLDRAKENWAGRKKMCIYDEAAQAARFVHLDTRLLVHFYAFLFFQDWREDLWMKRFIRDHVRYVDEIQCAAARAVAAVRERARSRDPANNPEGKFDSFHVRRGDFQYKDTRVDASVLVRQAKKKFKTGATVWIATDERNKTFFDPLKEFYDVAFLDDVHEALGHINSNYYGMVDTLVAARGRYFIGCWLSSFTAYINRLRGYHFSLKEKTPGYEKGIIPSWYYALERNFDEFQTYYPLKDPIWAQEFPTSWRLIDTSVDAT